MLQLRHKIAQMLIMGFNGCEIHAQSDVVQWLEQDGLGGVILFDKDNTTQISGKNLTSKQQIKQLTGDLRSYAQCLSQNALPLFIAIDYEGGAIDNLSNIAGCMTTKPPAVLALLNDNDFLQETSDMARTLQELGFNLNFAPVVDLSFYQQHGIIGALQRSFSNQPHAVAHAAAQFVHAFSQQKIVCAYKHFPGHGSAHGDTHEGCVDVTDSFQENELVPYGLLLQGDNKKLPAMVMTAHVVNHKFDPTGLPATLSYAMLTQLLREKIGFDGVLISDDLQMHAISQHYSMQDALRLTINAGADMIIFSNQWAYTPATAVIDCIEMLVNTGEIPLQRIDEAYSRILFLKRHVL